MVTSLPARRNGSVTEPSPTLRWSGREVEGLSGIDAGKRRRYSRFFGRERFARFPATLIEGKLSLRAALTAELIFDNCLLPEDALLPGSDGLRSPLTCLKSRPLRHRLGRARARRMACYEEAVLMRSSANSSVGRIASFQLVQAKLARMLTELTKAQLLAFRLAQLKDAGTAKHYHISMAKMNNVEIALELPAPPEISWGA